MRHAGQKFKDLAAKLGVSICGLLLILGLAEGLVRATQASLTLRVPRDFEDQKKAFYRALLEGNPSEELLYRFKPRARAELPYPEHFVYLINDYGMRDSEYPIRKPADILRIVGLGDSVTAGFGVNLDDSYLKQLERSLNSRSVGKRYEVINFAVDGYNTAQELALFQAVATGFAPDVVVLGFCLNDITPVAGFYNFGRSQHLLDDALYDRARGTGRAQDVVKELMRHSGFYLFLAESYNWLLEHRGAKDGFYEVYVRFSEGDWAFTLDKLGQIAQAVKEQGASLLLVIFPYRFQVNHRFRMERSPQERLSRFARSKGIRVLDLTTVYKEAGGESLFVPIEFTHPNRAGHKVAAQAIHEALIAERIIR